MGILWLRNVSVHLSSIVFMVVVESGPICVSRSPHCGRVSLSKKGGTDTQRRSEIYLSTHQWELDTLQESIVFGGRYKRERGVSVCNSSGLLQDQKSHQMISLSDIKNINTSQGSFILKLPINKCMCCAAEFLCCKSNLSLSFFSVGGLLVGQSTTILKYLLDGLP